MPEKFSPDQIKLGNIFPEPDKSGLGDQGGPSGGKKNAVFEFNLKPLELEAYLEKYVIRQQSAKEVLATKICTHFNRLKLPESANAVGNIKNNVLLIGPTGVGKTYLIKLIAKKLGVPFVKSDATKFSETGYVGGDVEQLVRDLVTEADGDISLAEHGIIYIDEIDKIASSSNLNGLDVSRSGVQRNLLKLMEDTEVNLKVPHDLASQMEAAMKYQKTGKIEQKKVSTKNILFVVSGAFNELDKIVAKRLNRSLVGFIGNRSQSRMMTDEDLLKQVSTADLVEYGFEPEFVGRLPVTARLDSLSADDLFQLLKMPECELILSKKRDFLAYGIHLFFEEEVLRLVAEEAVTLNTGARGLVSVIEKKLLPFEKHLPSTQIKQLFFTVDLYKNPLQELEKLLAEPDPQEKQLVYHELVEQEARNLHDEAAEFVKTLTADQGLAEFPFSETGLDLIARIRFDSERSFSDICHQLFDLKKKIERETDRFNFQSPLMIEFDREAQDLICRISLEENKRIEDVCHEILKDYPYALKLLSPDKISKITLSGEAVKDPETYLNKLVVNKLKSST
ncbi:MAG: AAA family ATPase [bacterium]